MPEYQRKLPHFLPDNTWLFLTWRRWGSMPAKADSIIYSTPGHAFVAQDRILEDRRSTGPRWLLDPRIADLVANTILIGESERRFYQLGAWVVMSNHASVGSACGSSPTTDEMAERIDGPEGEPNPLGRTGEPFWQAESWDHYLRSAAQIDRTKAYIEQNPVSAGLVGSAECWRWSSAGWQAKPPTLPKPPGLEGLRVG